MTTRPSDGSPERHQASEDTMGHVTPPDDRATRRQATVSRRRLMQRGGAAVAAVSGLAGVGGMGALLVADATGSDSTLARPGPDPLHPGHQAAATPVFGSLATPTPQAAFTEPPVLASADGYLAITLQARPDPDRGANRMAYERSLPGPTWHVRPGDRLDVTLVNALGGDLTNLHVHGLHVSPLDNGDNVFIHVENGQSFNYQYDIPLDHQPGLYWYHPHAHGVSSRQVAAGLGGAIIVAGALDDLPGIAGLPERLIVLQGPFIGPDGEQQYLVNGQLNPQLDIQPGETQRWRVLNASANAFFNLQLVGHSLHQIGTDGNPLPEVQTVDRISLSPSERAEFLIQGGPRGIYELRSLPFAVDVPGQAQPQFIVASLVSSGELVEPAPLPTTLIDREDLTHATIDVQRVITFQENSSPPTFAIDGQAFVEGRVDQVVQLGATEEWILRNDSPEWHPFHIHVNDFQVMTVNGRTVPRSYDDTTQLPPRGEVVIRTRFIDFTGRFVYHCHILGHEDAGMMGTVEVVD